MFKHFIGLIALFTCMHLCGQIHAPIKQITVFRLGAQIERSSTVSLKQGYNEVIFHKIAAGFDDQTIQLKASEDVKLVSVQYRHSALHTGTTHPVAQLLEGKIENLKTELEDEAMFHDSWEEEELLLTAYKKFPDQSPALNVDQLHKMADLYRLRLLEVKQKKLAIKRKMFVLESRLDSLNKLLRDFHSKHPTIPLGEIVVGIYSQKAAQTDLTLTYIDMRARWETAFDLNVKNLKEAILLTQKAKISQNTGEDWVDVQIKLSTGNPSSNIIAPKLEPWFLQYNSHYYPNEDDILSMAQSRANGNVRVKTEEVLADNYYNSVEENITFLEYTLHQKLNIASGSPYEEVSIMENEIQAEYRYYAVPAMDNRVYLVAGLLDWSSFNISSGPARLYFEGTYIGNSFIDAMQTKDTLFVSLGPDIAIAVKKDKIKQKSATKFLSSKKELTAGWEIFLKNNKTVAVDIQLQERLPLATNSNMEVNIENISDAHYDPKTGFVTWHVQLKPGEQTKKQFVYSVKIPKDQHIKLF